MACTADVVVVGTADDACTLQRLLDYSLLRSLCTVDTVVEGIESAKSVVAEVASS